MSESTDPLGQQLWKILGTIPLGTLMRARAEDLRDETARMLIESQAKCPETQRLIESLRVEPGESPDAYRVVADGKQDVDLETGTRITTELPWLLPAFVTLERSIRTCLQQTLREALLRAGRLHRVR